MKMFSPDSPAFTRLDLIVVMTVVSTMALLAPSMAGSDCERQHER
jgi:Tfp pilus assembly protein FimT